MTRCEGVISPLAVAGEEASEGVWVMGGEAAADGLPRDWMEDRLMIRPEGFEEGDREVRDVGVLTDTGLDTGIASTTACEDRKGIIEIY
jgi:hypothetical protein